MLIPKFIYKQLMRNFLRRVSTNAMDIDMSSLLRWQEIGCASKIVFHANLSNMYPEFDKLVKYRAQNEVSCHLAFHLSD
jgi:hypothetical protein